VNVKKLQRVPRRKRQYPVLPARGDAVVGLLPWFLICPMSGSGCQERARARGAASLTCVLDFKGQRYTFTSLKSCPAPFHAHRLRYAILSPRTLPPTVYFTKITPRHRSPIACKCSTSIRTSSSTLASGRSTTSSTRLTM
jgi:hypothetical protein